MAYLFTHGMNLPGNLIFGGAPLERALALLAARPAPADDKIDDYIGISELIGNNDRHLENISLLIREDGEYQGVAPADDILPMRYASLGAGVDPDLTPIEPKVGSIGAQPEVWARALAAAERFWMAAMSEDLPAPISHAMRQLAHENLRAARAFAAPLLPRL